MSLSNGVLTMTADQATTEAVKTALGGQSRFVVQGAVREMIGLAAQLEVAAPSAVLVDIDADPQKILAGLDPLIQRYAETRFVVFSREMRGEWVLESMRAGARHYLLKPDLPEQLLPTLTRLVPESQGGATQRPATVITILSGGGGCGATTLAINLANELRLASGKPTLLIDLDRSYAAISSYLGLEGRYGVGQLLSQGDRLDAELINSTALRYGDALDVLISNSVLQPGEVGEPDLRFMPKLIEASATVYEGVVIDASRVAAPSVVPFIDLCTATLLLLRLNVVHLRLAKDLITALSEHGVSASTIVPVASHYHKRRSVITLADAQRALFDRPLGVLSDDEASAAAAANYGQPLAECAPRSTLRKEIRAFAERAVASRKENLVLTTW